MSQKSNQLSLVAQYDDLMRIIETLFSEDDFDSKLKLLIQNCEKQRLINQLNNNEFNEKDEKINKLIKKNRSLETTLKNVRDAFKKELSLRERIQSERDLLYTKLNQVQNYLKDDSSNDDRTSLKETILSSLNLNKLTVIQENSNEDSSHSLSGVEFEKTDEDCVDDNSDLIEKMKIDKLSNNLQTEMPIQKGVFENEDEFEDFSMLNDTMIVDESDAIVTPIMKRNTPSSRSQTSVNSKRSALSALSETIIKQRQSKLPNDLNVDNRAHQFVSKKIFKSEKCCVCANAIGFMSTCFNCRDCRAICHQHCKDQVPLPCIPYVSRAGIGKKGRLILISDYVQSNCKPCVPALIVHCLSEIEKRGLNQVGIYRVPASEKEVKELKEKILKSKQGIPQLMKTEIHVLCNVVKKFLLQLDEALIMRISWREFVEVTSITNEEERRSRFKEAILNLPNANRDTLAFLMLHLRRVSEQPENKMTISNLAKMFGPTVLGYSMRDPPTMQIYEENKKQHQVVEYLMNLDDEFWRFIIDLDANAHLNFSIIGDVSLHLSPEQIRGRPSIGSRLCGGTVNTGTITPLKNKKRKDSKKLNPMF